jgi:xanthine dehydrogenase molybdenum-binding subunit
LEANIRLENLDHTDSRLKATGNAVYISDMVVPNMLYGGILRSSAPHARVIRIDVSKATALPGVRAVITFEEARPYGVYNCSGTPPSSLIIKDEYIISDKVRYFGDKIAAVAAEDKKTLKKALSLIEVDLEELPAVFDIEGALAKNAPQVHDACPDNIVKVIELGQGDPEKGFEQADVLHEGEYETHSVQAAPLETTGCICSFLQDASLTVWSNTQAPHQDKRTLSELFKLPESRVRLIQLHIGGAFGSRQQMHQEPLAALLSKMTGAPVSLMYSREEEFIAAAVRHACKIRIKTGLKENGIIVAMSVHMFINTGAYATHGPIVLAAVKSRIPYVIPNYRFTGTCVYTHTAPAGAMRGYGNPQLSFAREVHLDEIAAEMQIDPLALRLKNRIRTGDALPGVGWKIESCGLEACAKTALEEKERAQKLSLREGSREHIRSGWGIAFCLHGSGIAERDMGSAIIILNDDGSIHLLTGAVDLGQGSNLALAKIAAAELGIDSVDRFSVTSHDTAATPYDTGSFSSRQVYVSGKAVQKAAQDAKLQLLATIAKKIECSAADLEIKNGLIVNRKEDRSIMAFDKAIRKISYGASSAVIIGRSSFKPTTSPPPFAVCWANVDVNTTTGELDVPLVIIAVDVGKAINRQGVEGQIEGGVLMGIGYALRENIAASRLGGRSFNTGFMRYGLATAREATEIKIKIIESNEPTGPFGAKSVGELPTIPVAPAIANAVYDATGKRIRELPLSPERVLRYLKT